MEETKKQKLTVVQPTPANRRIRFAALHDALTPLQGAPIMSLRLEGNGAVAVIEERAIGIYTVFKDQREFIVPYGNVAFYEYLDEK